MKKIELRFLHFFHFITNYSSTYSKMNTNTNTYNPIAQLDTQLVFKIKNQYFKNIENELKLCTKMTYYNCMLDGNAGFDYHPYEIRHILTKYFTYPELKQILANIHNHYYLYKHNIFLRDTDLLTIFDFLNYIAYCDSHNLPYKFNSKEFPCSFILTRTEPTDIDALRLKYRNPYISPITFSI